MTAWRCFCVCRGSALRFFWRRRIGAMADCRHHGEGEHHQGNVAMPPMPGSALVVIESELVFRGLETVLNRPSMAFDCHQRFDGCCGWTPGGNATTSKGLSASTERASIDYLKATRPSVIHLARCRRRLRAPSCVSPRRVTAALRTSMHR